MKPQRLTLSRRKGDHMPPGTIVCDRRSKWGNPHRVTDECPPAEAVHRFRDDLENGRLPYTVEDVRRELGGRPLGCWCRQGNPCHADALIEIANPAFPQPVTTFEGDAAEVLWQLPAESVDCIVTSPPYFGLRDYGHPGQLGREATVAAYVENLMRVLDGCARALRPEGVLWLNLGDSYNAYNANRGASASISDGRDGNRAEAHGKAGRGLTDPDRKNKELLGVPWRVAFAAQDAGWYLRQDVVWAKPNPMPESVRDRCTRAHEYLFMLTRRPRYYFDAEAIAEPPSRAMMEQVAAGYHGKSTKLFAEAGAQDAGRTKKQIIDGARKRMERGELTRNRRSVWTVPTASYAGAHFAVFPPDLIRPCVLSSSARGGVVLDPFAGTGTTAAVAVAEGRRAVQIEISPDFAAIARETAEAAAQQPSLDL